jgi:hypothetical protein
MDLTAIFSQADTKDMVARCMDLAAVATALQDIAALVGAKIENPGMEVVEGDGWTKSFCCSRLCPRDFDKQVFDGLEGFQVLVNECFKANAAFWISVEHMRNLDSFSDDRNPKYVQEAAVYMQVDPAKPFREGVIVIDGDQFIRTMGQAISANEYTSIPVYRPLKLKAPAQTV